MLRGLGVGRWRVAPGSESPPPSQNPPTVTIDSPVNAATITANDVAFYASAQDEDGVERVELYVNDGFKRSEVDPPYGWGGPDGAPNLDLTGYPDGPITFKAIAYDVTGLTAQDEVSCTLDRTPSATPLFDGRATLMSSITGSTLAMGSGSNASQSPAVWGESPGTPSGLYFMQRAGVNDITLVSDATYTTVYKFSIGQGSTNPYLTLNSEGRASGELTKPRPISPGQVDWYADAIKLESPWHMPTSSPYCIGAQYAFPSLSSPPLSICLDLGGWGIDRHVGMIPTGQTLPQIITKPRFFTLAEVIDKWVEWIIGVEWQFDVPGEINVYTRIPADGESTFTLQYSDTTRPTQQYKQGESFKTKVNDKTSNYFGTFPVGSIQNNIVYHRGFTRWATMADAVASMG